MSFVCDVMLGKLARWLRILGFDTIYFRDIDDNELIKVALQQARILLTRDTGIARRRRMQTLILIHSNNTLEQLKEVLSALNTFESNLPPRCPLCNGRLIGAETEAVADRIPEYVLLHAAPFFTCGECGKVYWCGSHKKSIEAILKKISCGGP